MRKLLLLILILAFNLNLFAQPSLTSANYDERTSILTLNFDRIVQNENVIRNKVSIIPGGILSPVSLDENSAIVPHADTNFVQIVLYNEGNFSLKDQILTLHENSVFGLKVGLEVGAVIDAQNQVNTESLLQDLTFAENAQPFDLANAVFEAEGNYLKMHFNNAVTIEAISPGDIVMRSSSQEVAVSSLYDNIIQNADSSIWIQFNSATLAMLHMDDFEAGFTVNIKNGAIRDMYWNPIQTVADYSVTYNASEIEVYMVSALYNEDKNRFEIDFNVDIQSEDWLENSFINHKGFTIMSATDTLTILNIPDIVSASGETVRIKVERGDQGRIESTFGQLEGDIRIAVSEAAVYSEDTYIPCDAGEVSMEYVAQDEDRQFALDASNTFYDGSKHLLNIAFQGTSSSLYNTINRVSDDSNPVRDSVDFISGKIHFTNGVETLTLPLGMLVSYDSVSSGLFRLPSTETRTMQLINMGTENLQVIFEPFTFFNRRDHGNFGAEFDLNFIPDGAVPMFESVLYDTEKQEVFFYFNKPVDTDYNATGIKIGGMDIGTVDSAIISEDQKVVRLQLTNGLSGLPLDPDVEVPAGAFQSIFGVPNDILNAESENYAAVVKGIGRYFWMIDQHKFPRGAYQKFCLLRENEADNVSIYVDVDDWQHTVTQSSLDQFLMTFNETTPDAQNANLQNGVFDAVQSLYGTADFNEDGKVIVVLTDIQDNYDTGGNDSNINLFIPGYFEPDNALSADEYRYSNESDMFFLDTWPQYWDFDDTTGLNDATEDGLNTYIQGMTDIFTRTVIGKNSPDESAWALDGFAGLSQIMIAGEYSQFFLNTLGIKPVNSGMTPFSGNYNFSTRDNQIASTGFVLYLFENVYPDNQMQFLNEFFANDSSSSLQKVSLILDGHLTDWFNAYAIAQALEGDQTFTLNAGDNQFEVRTGFDYVEYEAIPVLNLPRFFDSPKVGTASKSVGQLTLYTFTIPNDSIVAVTNELKVNANAADVNFSAFTFGQSVELGGLLNDENFAVMKLDFDEDNNSVIPRTYPDGSTFGDNESDDYNYHILTLCASQANDVIISTDGTSPATAEFYMFPNVINQKYVTMGIISDEELYYDTQELPKVFVDFEETTQEVTIEQKESNIGVNEYTGTWQFQEAGSYAVRVVANDRSGNVANISTTNIEFSRILNTDPVHLENIDMQVSYSASGSRPDIQGAVILEQITADHEYYNIHHVAEGTILPVKVMYLGQNDPVNETLSFNTERPDQGIFKLEGDEWIEIPARRHGTTVTANISGEGIYQLRSSGGELVESVPVKFALYKNYPNPFNPVTTIRYDVSRQTRVQLMVYNVLGQRVKTLVNQVQEPASYQIQWNGKDTAGIKVASGLYFLTFKAGNVVLTNKMILLK